MNKSKRLKRVIEYDSDAVLNNMIATFFISFTSILGYVILKKHINLTGADVFALIIAYCFIIGVVTYFYTAKVYYEEEQ